MNKPFFWKSALKASVLVYFAVAVLGFAVYWFFVGANGFEAMLSTVKENREMLESLSGIGSLITIVSIFWWVLFAKIEEQIPVRSLLGKVFLFNTVMSVLSIGFFYVFPGLLESLQLLFGQTSLDLISIAYFAVFTVGFWKAYAYFKPKEKFQSPAIETKSLGSPRRRIAAYLIDTAILWFSNILIFIAVIIFGLINLFTIGAGFFEILFYALIFFWLLSTVTSFLYWTVLEARGKGSLGKRVLGLRVVSVNGQNASFQNAFFRNAPKFVTGMELFLAVELFFLLQDPHHQRLFDQVADTIVVRTKKEVSK